MFLPVCLGLASAQKRSGATGFDAAALGVPREHLASLESKGLVEQAREGSYCATTAGIQVIGAFAGIDWNAAEVSLG